MPARIRLLIPLCAGALCGCLGPNADVDLLEARLRDQQDVLARYEKLIDSTSDELQLARGEAELLRSQLANAGEAALLPEQADVLLRAEKLAFHSLMTGARDVDGVPGDDSLNIVLTPQSEDGDTVRLVGALEIEALDLSREVGDQSIGRWIYSPEEARDLWHGGFLASGFQLDLPWQELPQSQEVTLHARLSTIDGRQLNATHQIRVGAETVQLASLHTTSAGGEPNLLPGFENRPRAADFVPPSHLGREASAVGTTARDAGFETRSAARPVTRSNDAGRSLSGAEFLSELDAVPAHQPTGRRIKVPPPRDAVPRGVTAPVHSFPMGTPQNGLLPPGEPVLAPPAFPEPVSNAQPPVDTAIDEIRITPLRPLDRPRQGGEAPATPVPEKFQPPVVIPPEDERPAPSPFPTGEGVSTSVNWTAEDVPVLR